MSDSAFQKAFACVKALVADFETQRDFYLSPQYQESEARKDFIDKFLIALGWDVNHDTQKNPYEQEVKVERRGEAALAQRRADYAFYLAPNFRDVRFYLEAKKPSVEVRSKDAYFQIIRYGWGASTPVGVVTDFEQFHVIDCRAKPDIDTALDNEIDAFHYRDYLDEEKFAKIYFRFSREAHATGAFDRWAAQLPARRRGRAVRAARPFERQVDEHFLEHLDGYREKLAISFKRENPELDGPALTEITQRTIDRIIFMRFLEDKQIYPEDLVRKIAHGQSPWSAFVKTSRRLDGIYNGIVFKEHPTMDALSFKADDKAFAAIAGELSDPLSPYNFDSIPIHILGSIYERFLGKVIVASDKRARVEEKPEVRKAGGVYYTPEYIVRYIVENTVGKLIEGKSPAQIAEMRFADIACGSGSFLLGVYDYLLRYHSKWYNDNPEKALTVKGYKRDKKTGKKVERLPDCDEREGQLFLTLHKRREILLNNIYGVDLDPQAVEVAQLSLYLKLLQEETAASAREHQLEFHETLLPPLHKNIVCGNSLIGTDILTSDMLTAEQERELRPIDFKTRFADVFRKGGFDVIAGNPPYGAILQQEEYIRANFETAGKEEDTYVLFIERALSLTRPGGFASMIVPTGWYSGPKFSKVRKFAACCTDPIAFINLPYDVFQDAWVDTTVFVFEKRPDRLEWPRTVSCDVSLKTFPKRHKIKSSEEFSDNLLRANLAEWFAAGGDEYLTYADSATTQVFQKILAQAKPFSDYADIQRGVTPFHLTDTPEHKNSVSAFEGTVRRYVFERGPMKFIRFDDSLAELKPEKYFRGQRLLLRELISRQFQLQAAYTDLDFITNKSMQSILPVPGGPDAKFLLAVLNSKLMSWFFLHKSNIAQRDDFPKIVLKETRQLPFPRRNPDFENKLAEMAAQITEARKQLALAATDRDKSYYEYRCADLDRQIDQLVYQLYGLTPEEIAIVEGTATPESKTDKPPPTPAPNKEQAWADSAHFYSAKEESPPYDSDK